MSKNRVLIANRGEVALRIIDTAIELDIEPVVVYTASEANSLSVTKANDAVLLAKKGVQAYLDIPQLIAIAQQKGCNLLHPGYGFLSESAALADACARAGIIFVGPSPTLLKEFGNKHLARQLARQSEIPTISGVEAPATPKSVYQFFKKQKKGGAILLKAVAGGGGRGMAVIREKKQTDRLFEQCSEEAEKSFGNGDLYAEQYLENPRHLEVQIVGDGEQVTHLWERECSLQRRHQKLIEMAPCPAIDPDLRKKLVGYALKLGYISGLQGIATVEFLVDGAIDNPKSPCYFIEVNPRLQVEHTVTESITGLDLVAIQFQLALGRTLRELGLKPSVPPPKSGMAMQIRINAEQVLSGGEVIPQTGTVKKIQPPFGKGVRLDTHLFEGFIKTAEFDSLLAKLIVHTSAGGFPQLIRKTLLNMESLKIEGVVTNMELLKNILKHPKFVDNQFHTQFFKKNINDLLPDTDAASLMSDGILQSPMPGTLTKWLVSPDSKVSAGDDLVIVEAMKMETVIEATHAGKIGKLLVNEGSVIVKNQPLAEFLKQDNSSKKNKKYRRINLEYLRSELKELQQRKAWLLDENRTEAVKKRKTKGKQTARENIAQLCDTDSFREFGSLIVAAQRSRRTKEDLIKNTPADGIITGTGSVNGALFGESKSRCMVLCYDYTVLAGTQGMFGHQKTDRALELAHRAALPVVLFAEGGGGRPGDTDFQGVGGLQVKTFAMFARLNGIAPRVAIVSGYCFAGNAALAGCSDVIIATKDTSIGMGGPAMIEGGGLGKFHPAEVGPIDIQTQNGVIDVVAENEQDAIILAKKYLAYFQGNLIDWKAENQRALRHLIPENRRRTYDIRHLIGVLADEGSVMELRSYFAPGMITALVRIEGQTYGLLANNPRYLGGAIDANGSDKAARFLQLCNTFHLPVISLCDTPGFMVGPEAEKTGLVRHTSRLFTIGAKLTVPVFTIVMRKAYGLGSMAMAGGGMHEAFFTVAWPTGEFGGMGLEGAVRLGYRKELEAVKNAKEREALFQKMVQQAYEHGKALNTASYLEIDEVIDPADTRKWVVQGWNNFANKNRLDQKNNDRFTDTW